VSILPASLRIEVPSATMSKRSLLWLGSAGAILIRYLVSHSKLLRFEKAALMFV